MTVTTISTPGASTYTVPAGVRWISVELNGCAGGTIAVDGSTLGRGGRGAKMKVLVHVRPGEVLDVGVGRLGFAGNTDACRGGVPTVALPGPPGGRAGAPGGGGTYIARRTYTGGANFEERLRSNMIAVAGGGGGGRSPLAPFGWGVAGDYFGGSSNSFETLVARYITYGDARENATWMASNFLADPTVGAIKSASMDRLMSSNSAYGGLGGEHLATSKPTYANDFNGGAGESGGAGGGGGYQGGAGGKLISFGGSDTWGSAGGAGLSWWDPYVSSVYYSSIGKYNTGNGSVVIDDNPSLTDISHTIQSSYFSESNPSALPTDYGAARLVHKAPVDGFPPYNTELYMIPGVSGIYNSGEAATPFVGCDIRTGASGSFTDGTTTSSAVNTSIIAFGAYGVAKSWDPNPSSVTWGWLPGLNITEFETRAGILKGNVVVSPVFVRYSIPDQGKTWDTNTFSINYTTQHAPSATLLEPASAAKVPIPATTGVAADFKFRTSDLASIGARPAYRDKITEYEVNFYAADQTTRVGGATVVPSVPIEYTGSSVQLSVSPSLTVAEWAQVEFWDARVKDSKGTWSAPVAKRSIDMLARPVIEIVSPLANAVIEGSKPSISTSVDTPNGSGIFTTRYQILTSSLLVIHDQTFSGYAPNYTPDVSVFAGVGSYIIRVTVTDLYGVTSTAEIPVTSDYAAPPAVKYEVDATRVDEEGYVEVSWGGTIPAEGFARWDVYRREMPGSTWVRLGTVPNAGITVYRDYTAIAGRIYMYSVTQTTVDRGGEIEGVVGVHQTDKTFEDLANLASHPSPGYLSADVPVGQIGFTSKAEYAFGASTSSSVIVDTPPAGLPDISFVGKGLTREVSGSVSPFSNGVSFSRYAEGPTGFSGPDADGSGGLAASERYINATLWVYSDVSIPEAALVISHRGSGGETGRTVRKLAVPPATWVRASVSHDVGAVPSPKLSVAWYDHAGDSAQAIASTITLAGLQVVESAEQIFPDSPPPFFNGARPDDVTFSYSWIGVPWETQSVRKQIVTREEDRTLLIVNSHYWLIDPTDPSSAMKLPNVKSYDFTDEYERNSTHVIGRGRHVDFGDRLGRNGTLVLGLRGSGPRNMKREDIFALVQRRTTFTLKTPFGESFSVALGDPGWSQLAGTGSADMGDLTLPFEEVY